MVIQLPNPLLLPQSYGMGEVAGMSFGSNYTIFMQIGYAFYAPRILKEMEKHPEKSFAEAPSFIKFQKELVAYSDKSIEQTMDRVLAMPDTIIKAILDKMGEYLGGISLDDETTETITNIRYDEGQGVRRGKEEGLSPYDEDILRNKKRQEEKTKLTILQQNRLTADNYIKNNPISSQPDWELATPSLNKSGHLWQVSTVRLSGSSRSTRRRSQSSNLNVKKLQENLNWYLTEFYKFRNDSSKNQTNNIETFWRKVKKYSQWIITFNAIYI